MKRKEADRSVGDAVNQAVGTLQTFSRWGFFLTFLELGIYSGIIADI